MPDLLQNSVFLGLMLTFLSYEAGLMLKKKLKLAIFNPLLVSIVLCMAFLIIFHIDYASYQAGTTYISYLLTPATVCLAIPLYRQFELLKKNKAAVFAGIISGVLTSLVSILVLSLILGFDHREYVSLLPKSITTAIGMDVSAELGGYVPISVALIVITGIFGNIFGELLFKIFRIREPIARGVALGTCSHAIGTSKAMELGEVEGAMGSLSIVIAGILTVIGASVFSLFL